MATRQRTMQRQNGYQRIVDLIEAASKPRSAFGGGESPSMGDVSSNSSRLTRRTQSLLMSLLKDGTLKCTKVDLAMSMFNVTFTAMVKTFEFGNDFFRCRVDVVEHIVL